MTLPHDIEISQIRVFGEISGDFWELPLWIPPDLTIKSEHSRHNQIQQTGGALFLGNFWDGFGRI